MTQQAMHEQTIIDPASSEATVLTLPDQHAMLRELTIAASTSAIEEDELAWQQRALCAQTDPEAFFPEKGGSTRDAKKVCVGCEVRSECLEYALLHDERFGIWGGLSERERRKLKKRAV